MVKQAHNTFTIFPLICSDCEIILPLQIELLHPLGDKSPISGFLKKNSAGGIHHVCIEVDDIDAAVKDLKAKNIRDARKIHINLVTFLPKTPQFNFM